MIKMRVLVGISYGGHFFAYDASTFDKLKNVYLEMVNDHCSYHKEPIAPTYSEEEIDNLPKELRGEAKRQWSLYNSDIFEQKEWENIKNKMMNAKSEEELDEIIEDYELYDSIEEFRHLECVEVRST